MLSPSLADLRAREPFHPTVIEFESIARDHIRQRHYQALTLELEVWNQFQNQCTGAEGVLGPAIQVFVKSLARIDSSRPLIDQLIEAVEESVWKAAETLGLAVGMFMLVPSQRRVRHRRDPGKNLAFGNQLKLWSAFRILFMHFGRVVPDGQFVNAMSLEAEGVIAPPAKYACRINNELLLGSNLRVDRDRGVGYYLTDVQSPN